MKKQDSRLRTLGETIKNIRNKKGISQRELADLIKTNKVYVYRIEKGEVSPTLRTLQRLADALGAELTVSIGTTPIYEMDDETAIKTMLLYLYKVKDKDKRESILESLNHIIPQELMSYHLDSNVTEFPTKKWKTEKPKEQNPRIYSLTYNIDAKSYRLIETEDRSPVGKEYLAVRTDNSVTIFIKESKEITDPNKAVLIKFISEGKMSKKEKIFFGTYKDFITIKNIKTTVLEKYTVAYIIPS